MQTNAAGAFSEENLMTALFDIPDGRLLYRGYSNDRMLQYIRCFQKAIAEFVLASQE